MPSFVIDEIHVGDIVSGEVALRDVSYGEEPLQRIQPYFPDEEPPRMMPFIPEPIQIPMPPEFRI